MDEKILQNLITLYRSKGVQLDQIVNSELFKSLPVDKKLQVIKALGQQSQDKIKTIDSSDVKKILLGLGLATIAGVYLRDSYSTLKASQLFNKTHAAAIAKGTLTAANTLPSLTMGSLIAGMGAGAASSLGSAYTNWDHKNQLKQMNTSSDNAILHYLSERERYVSA
jgi:hypothetical protein